MSQVSPKVKFSEEQETIEIPNSGGVRKSKLATIGDTILFPYENLKTTWDAIEVGRQISGDDRCFGWRSSKCSYSWITYNKFVKRAENFGSGLIKIGLTGGQLSNVGIYAQNSVEWVVAQYGIWSQSAVLIPIHDSIGPDASIFMINHAEITVLICDIEQKAKHLIVRKSEIPTLKHIILVNALSNELQNLAKEKNVKLHSFSSVEEIGEKIPTRLMYPKTSDIALICFTSGTTGDSKGAMLTHQNLMSASTTLRTLIMGDSAISKEDSLISYLPLSHMLGQLLQLMTLIVGGSIGFFCGDINQLVDDMRILQPTIFPAVPRILNKLYDKAQGLIKSKLNMDLCVDNIDKTLQTELKSICKPFIDGLGGRIRLIIFTGAPISKTVLEFYTKIVGCKVIESYGLTENSGPCTCVLIDSNYTGSVGSPIPCCVVKLVDVPEMGYFSKDSHGEICIKGHGVFRGYLKDPQKTEDVLDSEGWLHSGDIGTWLPNGTLKIIDRKKNILKLAQGLYVPLEKIESVYAQSSFVSQIFVEGDSLQSILVAIVIPEKEVTLAWCQQNLKKTDSWKDICENPSIKQIIFEDMIRVGKEAGLRSFEQVKFIHLHPEILTYKDGFLTPTLKLKREVCKNYFNKEIFNLINST